VICYRGLKFPQRAVVFLPLEIDAACSNLFAHFARKSAVLLEAQLIGNRICEGTDFMKAALRSGMTSLQVLVAYKKCGLWEQCSSNIAVSRAFTKHPNIHSENTRFKTL